MNARSVIKRGLKWGLEWAAALSGANALYRRSHSFRTGYRILTYHRVSKTPVDSFTVNTEHFKAHIAFLSDHYRVIPLGDLVEDMKRDVHHGAVAVTFDDGYSELAGVVGETLERHGVPATFFVVTGILDGLVKTRAGAYLSWNQVRELAERGFSIGSHSVTHRSLGEITGGEAETEIRRSRQRILDETGRAPLGLAYPYGTLRDFSPDIADLTRRAGYEFAVTAIHGLNRHGFDPFLLRRINLSEGDGPRTFRLIMKGCLDPWRLVDTYASAFQKPAT